MIVPPLLLLLLLLFVTPAVGTDSLGEESARIAVVRLPCTQTTNKCHQESWPALECTAIVPGLPQTIQECLTNPELMMMTLSSRGCKRRP